MRSALLSAALGVMSIVTSAAAAPPLADRLPAEANVYVGWAGRNLAFDGAMLGQVLNEPAAGEIAAAVRRAILEHVRDEQGRQTVEHALAMLSVAWQHTAALCVMEVPEVLADGELPVPRAALLIDLGKDRPAFEGHLAALLGALGPTVTVEDAAVGSVPYKTIRITPGVPPLACGWLGETFFVTVGADVPGRLIAVAGAAEKSLLNAPKFTAAYKEVTGPDEQYAVYVDVPAVAAMVRQIAEAQDEPMPPTVSNVIEALGVSKVTSVAGATRVVDRGLYSKTRLATPAPHQGVLMLLAGAPLSRESLGFVPADADFVITARLDPAAVLAEIKRVVTAIDPAAGGRLAAVLAGMDEQLGLALENDLLAHVGDQWTLVSAPSLGGPLTGTAWVVTLKDEAAFKAALARVEAFARGVLTPETQPREGSDRQRRRGRQGPSLVTIDVGETSIAYLRMPMGFVPAAPAWAVHEGKLIIAAWPQVIQGLIANAGGPALTAEPAFQAATARVSERPSILSYFNLPKIVRQGYAMPLLMWTAAANYLRGEGFVDARPDWLPSLSAFEKYLWPQVEAVSADEAGITIEGYGSLPLGPGAGALCSPATVGLGMSIVLPSLGRSRELARQGISQSQLKSIGVAIEMYKGGNRQIPPPNLQALVDGKYVTQKMLISPHSRSGLDQYVYFPQPDTASVDLVMAYEDPRIHGENRTPVLFVDGHVEMVPVDQAFWELVARSRAASMERQ